MKSRKIELSFFRVLVIVLLNTIGLQAQTIIFQSGFETGDPAFTYNATAGTCSNVTAAPLTGSNNGRLLGASADASVITPLVTFTAGRYYVVEVYAKAIKCVQSLDIRKSLTATNVAIKAAAGADIILNGTNNVTLTTYSRFYGAFLSGVTETKYVGFQMINASCGGPGTSTLDIDNVLITEYTAPPCDYYCATGNFTAITSNIAKVTFNTINNTTSWDGYVCTGVATPVQRTLSYTLTLLTNNATTSVKYVAAWIDYNANGVFTDPGEQVLVPTAITVATAPQNVTTTQNVTIPLGATIGVTKMRVGMVIGAAANMTACNVTDLSDYEDYDIDIQQEPVPMVYQSCTTTQTNVSSVNAGTVKQEVIGIQIFTTGELSPLTISSFSLSTAGTANATNDIANAQLWTTGTGGAFATTAQVGATVVAPNGAFTIPASYTLEKGTNYFWLTYDVPVSAPAGDVIDAQCTSINVGGARTPAVVSPAGNRPIIAATPMMYISSTTTQIISPVAIGDVNQQILGIAIVTSGALSPLNASAFSFSNLSTTPTDLLNARLYYTGTNNGFFTTTQVGATIAAPSGAFTITPNQVLAFGTNYFWLTYDISATAGCNPKVADASLTALTINAVAASPPPTIMSPAGSRLINCGVPYYSQGNLLMNNLSSWNSKRNGSGVAPVSFAATNDFYVQAGHSMTTNADFTINNLYVESSGYITASSIVTMANFRIYGGGSYEQTAQATLSTYINNFWIDDGGSWIHNNNGFMPGVNRFFTANSNQYIKQIGGGTFPGGTAWGNLIFDVNTSGNFVINGSSVVTVQGNWEWRKTGNSNYYTIAGDNSPVNIGRNLIFSGGTCKGAYDLSVPGNQVAAVVINVGGDFIIRSGQFEDYERGASGSGTTLNIAGNVSVSGGTWSYNDGPGGTSQINLTAAIPSSTWTQTGGSVTLCNTNIKTGKTISMSGSKIGNIATGRTFTVETGATLKCSNYPVTGAGAFALLDNSSIHMGDIDGIASAGAIGNVQTITRSFHSGANYFCYEGLTPQSTGVFTTSPAALTVRNLTINKNLASQSVKLSQNLSVTTATILTKGELSLNSNTLTALSNLTSAITGSAAGVSYIKSETNAATNPSIVQWNIGAANGTYIIPFGVSSSVNDYIPFTFSKTAGSSNVQFSTRATASNNNTPWAAVSNVAAVNNMNRSGNDSSATSVIDRWWDITALSGANSVTANLTFSYRAAENTLPNGITPAGYPNYQTGQIAAQHWNGTTWDLPVCSSCNNGVISGVGTVVVTGANTFSPWILVGKPAPLPIKLLAFEATVVENNKVRLDWSTASETDNDFFTVEKTPDGKTFFFVDKIMGAGNSSSILNYASMDNNPFSAVSYYRLKQTDYNGDYTYSQLVPVKINRESRLQLISNYCDEFNHLILFFTDDSDENCDLNIYNDIGQEIICKRISLTKGLNRFEINVEALTKGVYFIKAISDYRNVTGKMMIN